VRIDSRQFPGSVRTVMVVTAAAAVFALTSGLLLTIHLLTSDHSHCQDSPECSICRQFLILSKKALPVSPVERVLQILVLDENVPVFVEPIQHRFPQISRPRGPPFFLTPSVRS